MRASLQWKYERAGTPEEQELQRQQMRTEAIQTAATALRFLENL